MPSGYKFPAHNHPTDEYVTVISGNFHVGMGDKLDEKKAIELTAGGYVEAPAKMNHYGWVSSPSVVQIQAQGPFGITYVNPADDPSKTVAFLKAQRAKPEPVEARLGFSSKDGKQPTLCASRSSASHFPRAGLVALRQTFVRRRHGGWLRAAFGATATV